MKWWKQEVMIRLCSGQELTFGSSAYFYRTNECLGVNVFVSKEWDKVKWDEAHWPEVENWNEEQVYGVRVEWLGYPFITFYVNNHVVTTAQLYNSNSVTDNNLVSNE